jgi:hypothetical protein
VFRHDRIRQPFSDGRVVAMSQDYELPALPVSIVYPHARFVARRTRLFADSLRPRLAADLADVAAAG